MNRAVIVTKSSSSELLLRYNDAIFIGLEEGIDLLHEHGYKISLAVSDYKKRSAKETTAFVAKECLFKYRDDMKNDIYLLIINFLIKLGVTEVIILTELVGRYDTTYRLLNLTKLENIAVTIQNKNNYIVYYRYGNYIVHKQDYQSIFIIPFPQAIISLDHVINPLKKQFIDSKTPYLSNEILDRIASLRVDEGGVLLVQVKDE